MVLVIVHQEIKRCLGCTAIGRKDHPTGSFENGGAGVCIAQLQQNMDRRDLGQQIFKIAGVHPGIVCSAQIL